MRLVYTEISPGHIWTTLYHVKEKLSYQAIAWQITVTEKCLEAFCLPLLFPPFLIHLKITHWFLQGDCIVLKFSTCPHFSLIQFFCPIWQSRLLLQCLFHLYFVSFWAFIFIPLVYLLARNIPHQNCNGIRITSSSISNTKSYLSSDPTPVSPRQHHWCSCLAQQVFGVLAVLNELWSLRTSL